MTSLVTLPALSQGEIDTYRADGFLKLTGLFTASAIEEMRRILERCLVAGDEVGTGMAADTVNSYSDLAGFTKDQDASDFTDRLFSEPALSTLRASLDPDPWLFTQSLSVSVDSSHKGLGWHFGLDSYNYLRPEDRGMTIWVPLDPIRLDGQRGGMSVVPRSVYSGNDVMKLIYRMITRHLDDPEVVGKAFAFEHAHREFVWPILDGAEVELPFELGDALLFDRDLWHRSCPFLPGPMPRRRAFVLRAIGGQSRLDAGFYDQMCMFSRQTGWPTPSRFGQTLQKSIANGAWIRDAPDVRVF